MNRLKAEEARKIANGNSAIVQEQLDKIFELIHRSAKEGRFKLNYTSEIPDANLVSPLVEKLSEIGYKVESFSIKNINFMIEW